MSSLICTYAHKGSAITNLKDFCRVSGLEYIGKVFSKYNHLEAEGEFVKFYNKYYVLRKLRSFTRNGKIITTAIILSSIEDFSFDEFSLMSECAIILEITDNNEAVCTMGFHMDEIREAQEEVKNKTNASIFLRNNPITKATFMKM